MIYAALSPTEFKEYLRTAPTQIQEWHKELERKRQQAPAQDSPTNLLLEKAEILKKYVKDKILTESLFIRDLENIRKYIKEKVQDNTKQGLIEEIIKLSNEITPNKIRDKSYTLKAETQENLIDMASKLKDDGTLLGMLSKLFLGIHDSGKKEKYHFLTDIKKASLSDYLRKIGLAFLS